MLEEPIKKIKSLFNAAVKVARKAYYAPKDFKSYAILGSGVLIFILDAWNPASQIGEMALYTALSAVATRGYILANRKEKQITDQFWSNYDSASNQLEQKQALLKFALDYLDLGIVMPRKFARSIQNPEIEILDSPDVIEEEFWADFENLVSVGAEAYMREAEKRRPNVSGSVKSQGGRVLTYKLSFDR